MNTSETRDLVVGLLHRIAPEVDLASIDPHEQLRDAMDLDSIDFLTFVTAIHEKTGIEVPERDYPALSTLDGCVTYLVDGSRRSA